MPLPRWHRITAVILAIACLIGFAGACSSSSHPATTGTTSASPTTAATPTTAAGSPTPGSGSSAEAQVRANWTTFFKGSTPAATRIALLQNGENFASFIQAQANSSLAKSVSVTVNSVQVTSDTATVNFDLDLAGQSALPNQSGMAVLDGGTWKVSDSSFCALLALEGQHPSGCPG
jgi:hypothetical protein